MVGKDFRRHPDPAGQGRGHGDRGEHRAGENGDTERKRQAGERSQSTRAPFHTDDPGRPVPNRSHNDRLPGPVLYETVTAGCGKQTGHANSARPDVGILLGTELRKADAVRRARTGSLAASSSRPVCSRNSVQCATAISQEATVPHAEERARARDHRKPKARRDIPPFWNLCQSGKLSRGECRPRTDELVTSTELQRYEGGGRNFCGVIVYNVRPPHHAQLFPRPGDCRLAT